MCRPCVLDFFNLGAGDVVQVLSITVDCSVCSTSSDQYIRSAFNGQETKFVSNILVSKALVCLRVVRSESCSFGARHGDLKSLGCYQSQCSDHELIFAIECQFEGLLPELSELRNWTERFRQSENSLIGGVPVDLSLMKREVVCRCIELSRVAKACDSSQLRNGIDTSTFIAALRHLVSCFLGSHIVSADACFSDIHFVLESVLTPQVLKFLLESKISYLRQSSCFVRTNDTDGSQGLNSLQRLAKNLVLAHEVGSNRKGCSQSNWKTFRDEGNRNRDAIDNQGWHIDETRVLWTQVRRPGYRGQRTSTIVYKAAIPDNDHNHNHGEHN